VRLFQNESMQNLSYENMFDLHENEHVWNMKVEQHFHMNGVAQGLVLTQR